MRIEVIVFFSLSFYFVEKVQIGVNAKNAPVI